MFIKVKENRVLFASDVRKELGGNLKFVYDYLPESFEKVVDFKEDRRFRRSFMNYLKLAYNMAVSNYILLEDFLDYTAFIRLRKGQQICQLWHGAGAYKKFGYSRQLNENEKIKIHQGYKRYAKAIVSADAIRACYAEAFSMPIEHVQATGIPRTDIFFDNEYIIKTKQTLYQKYPIFKDKKVILFAPTYRGTLVKDAAYDFDSLKLPHLYNALHEDYVFIFKWHPAAYNNIKSSNLEVYNLEAYPDFYFDLSQYRDINDLLLITDILITDYSSVIFDYLLVDKPIIYYVPDLNNYSGDRGMYFNFSEYVYGDVVTNWSDLIDSIHSEKMEPAKRLQFRKKFMDACDGEATKKTCSWIFGIFC
ncbi:CDP-glycerol glycerophosphotransferase family protein [Anaerovorax odorimutans]|nr:CDP-glycerol glycerophosphotransferase family protein [Anaerovorax odorimutans]